MNTCDRLCSLPTPLREGGLPRSRRTPAHIGIATEQLSGDQTLRVTRSQQRSCVVDVGGCAHASLKGFVIFEMASSNARKQAAREHQRRFPGTPYPVALRAVSHAGNSLQVVVGNTDRGRPYWADLEERADGGDGPHVAIIGKSRLGRRQAIELMVASLTANPPRRGVEVVEITAAVGRIDQLIEERWRLLRRAKARDFREIREVQAARSDEHRDMAAGYGAVVVVIDDDHWIEHSGGLALTAPENTLNTLNELLRLGRALDLHTLLNVQTLESPILTRLAAQFSAILTVHDDGVTATWQVCGRTASDVVLPAPLARDGS